MAVEAFPLLSVHVTVRMRGSPWMIVTPLRIDTFDRLDSLTLTSSPSCTLTPLLSAETSEDVS